MVLGDVGVDELDDIETDWGREDSWGGDGTGDLIGVLWVEDRDQGADVSHVVLLSEY